MRPRELNRPGPALAILRIQVRLQQNLGREHVQPRFALLPTHVGRDEMVLGHRRREALVPEPDRKPGDLAGPFSERSSFARLLPFFAAHVDGQADNETDEGRELNRRVELKITGGSTEVAPAADAAPAADEAPAADAPAEEVAP